MPGILREMLESLKDNRENPQHHPESSTYEHIKIVTERLIKTGDMDLVMAALMHDIGKSSVSEPSEEGNWNSSHGHEQVSSQLVMRYKQWIQDMGANPYVVNEIVKNHMKVKFDAISKKDKDKLERYTIFQKLNQFMNADNMNRKWDLDEGKKNNHLKPVKVNRFVYHVSNPIFRDDILKNGLIPKGKSEAWLSDTNIKGKVIFATNSDNEKDWFDSTYNDDVYRIDTTKIKNKWYEDPNFSPNKEEFTTYNGKQIKLGARNKPNYHIITFENIPLEVIELIRKGTGESLLEGLNLQKKSAEYLNFTHKQIEHRTYVIYVDDQITFINSDGDKTWGKVYHIIRRSDNTIDITVKKFNDDIETIPIENVMTILKDTEPIYEGLNMPSYNPSLKEGDFVRILDIGEEYQSKIFKVNRIKYKNDFTVDDVSWYVVEDVDNPKLTMYLVPDKHKYIKIVGLHEGLNLPKKENDVQFGRVTVHYNILSLDEIPASELQTIEKHNIKRPIHLTYKIDGQEFPQSVNDEKYEEYWDVLKKEFATNIVPYFENRGFHLWTY